MNYIVVRVNIKNKNPINEELTLRRYANSQKLEIDAVFFDHSGQKDELSERAELLSFLERLKEGDRLFVSSLWTLGWRVGELVQIIAKVFEKNGQIVCAEEDENIHAKMDAKKLIAKLSQARSQNIKKGISKLGRPEGSRSKSKYDVYLPRIVEFLKKSRNISALSRELNISRTSLKDYIASRRL